MFIVSRFNILWVAIASCLSFSAQAQIVTSDSSSSNQTKTHHFKYFSQYAAGGMMSNDNGDVHFTFSTVHGATFRQFGVGLGLSYDSYEHWNSLPLLLVVNTELVKAKHSSFYLQLTGGYGKLWYNETDNESMNHHAKRSNKVEVLAGYKISSQKIKVYISGGFRSQELHYTQAPRWWRGGSPGESTVTRTINGVIIQLGVGL
jgi:hypothetical protein